MIKIKSIWVIIGIPIVILAIWITVRFYQVHSLVNEVTGVRKHGWIGEGWDRQGPTDGNTILRKPILKLIRAFGSADSRRSANEILAYMEWEINPIHQIEVVGPDGKIRVIHLNESLKTSVSSRLDRLNELDPGASIDKYISDLNELFRSKYLSVNTANEFCIYDQFQQSNGNGKYRLGGSFSKNEDGSFNFDGIYLPNLGGDGDRFWGPIYGDPPPPDFVKEPQP
jgi:hypothetical protein